MKPEAVEFDKDDRNLFQVEDLRLKADAIRYSILPKLHVLINRAILRIKEVYGIEVLEDSHLCQSPNFRLRRENELKTDYEWASIGFEGKRVKDKWHGLQRTDGKPVQIVPFQYRFVLCETGIQIFFSNGTLKGLSPSSYNKLLRFHLEHEGEIHDLCYSTEMTPRLWWGDGCEPFVTFAGHYKWMFQNGIFDNDFQSREVGYPIPWDALLELVDRFVWFYPVYDSYIQIAKDEEVRFTQLVERLNKWFKQETKRQAQQESELQESKGTNLLSEGELLKAKELAEHRIKVMPAVRWQVFQRDGWKCVACGRSAADDVVLHVDHIVPRSKGGKDEIDNYQTLCHICNIGKSCNDDTDLRNRPRRSAKIASHISSYPT